MEHIKVTLNEIADKVLCENFIKTKNNIGQETINNKKKLDVLLSDKKTDGSIENIIEKNLEEIRGKGEFQNLEQVSTTLNKQGKSIQKLNEEIQEKNPKIIVVEETEIKDDDNIATCGVGNGVSGVRVKKVFRFVEYFKKVFSTKAELQTSITNEANARANEDKKLQTSITNEANARSSAINSVNTTISNLQKAINTEATTRANEDKKLQANITNEANARSSAINTVNTSISSIKTIISGLQKAITGAASTVVGSNLAANRVAISDGNGKLAASGITTAQLNQLSTLSSRGIVSDPANQTAITGRESAGLTLNAVYNNGYPTTYGNALTVGGSGGSQLLLGWAGDTTTGNLYYRSRRDVVNTWAPWKRIAYADELTSIQSNYNSLKSSYNTLNTNYNSLKTTATNLQNNYNSLNSSYNTLNSNYNSLKSNYNTLSSNYNTLNSNYNTLNSNYNSLKSSYNTLNSNYNTLNSNYNSLKATVTNLQNELNTVGGWEILGTTTGSGSFSAHELDNLYGRVAFKVKGYVSTKFNASDLNGQFNGRFNDFKRNFNGPQLLLKADNFSLWNNYPWLEIRAENSSFNRSEKITVYYKIF